MSFDSQFQAGRRLQQAMRADTPAVTAYARELNPLTPPAKIRLDADTIRAALSVLPTAVADGEE